MFNPIMSGQLGQVPGGGPGSLTVGNSVFTPPPGIRPGTPEYEAWRTKYSTGGGAASGGVPHGDLAAATNAFMTGQAQAPFLANLPNYASNVAQRSQNIGSELKGQLPADVIRQIQQAAAERGIATGSPGSDNSNASYLQSLGLTSLGLQHQGSADLSQSIADTPVPQLFNPASLFVPEMLARLEQNAAQSGFSNFSSTNRPSTPRFSFPSSIQLPGGRLGAGTPNPGYGTVGAGAPSGPILGTTQTGGTDQQISSIASGDAYKNWWNTYGVPAGDNGQGPVPQGFNSWEDANQFTDELFADQESAYGSYGGAGEYEDYYE